jgi:hypothetical protein
MLGLYFFFSIRPGVLLLFFVVVYLDGGTPCARASVHSKVMMIRPDFFAIAILLRSGTVYQRPEVTSIII